MTDKANTTVTNNYSQDFSRCKRRKQEHTAQMDKDRASYSTRITTLAATTQKSDPCTRLHRKTPKSASATKKDVMKVGKQRFNGFKQGRSGGAQKLRCHKSGTEDKMQSKRLGCQTEPLTDKKV